MISSVALFALESRIGGGAVNAAMLMAGRLIQGFGGGGVGLLTNMIISDLVSERGRGKFSSILLGPFTLGTAIGPIVGGVLVEHGF
jgi:MFS family permease